MKSIAASVRLALAVCAALMFCVSVRADDAKPATLDVLVREALAKNPEIESARRKWQAAKEKIPQARAWPDPMAGVDFERMDSQNPFTYSDAEWMVSQQFPWFGKRGLRAKVEEGNAARAFQEYVAKGLEVAAMVKQAYYDIFQMRGELEINQRNQKPPSE